MCVCDSTLVSYLSFAYLQSRGVLSEALRPVSRGGDCVLQSSSHLALHGAPAGYIAKLESRMSRRLTSYVDRNVFFRTLTADAKAFIYVVDESQLTGNLSSEASDNVFGSSRSPPRCPSLLSSLAAGAPSRVWGGAGTLQGARTCEVLASKFSSKG